MNTTKKTEAPLKVDADNYPISPSRGGVSYICVNQAGKKALKELMVYCTKATNKKQSYSSTIIYLNNLLNTKKN